MKSFNYRSAWYSSRGFANEGVYVFGTITELDDFFEEHVASDYGCKWDLVMHHKSFDTAKRRCEREAQADRNRHTRCNEISSIYACHVSDVSDLLGSE